MFSQLPFPGTLVEKTQCHIESSSSPHFQREEVGHVMSSDRGSLVMGRELRNVYFT